MNNEREIKKLPWLQRTIHRALGAPGSRVFVSVLRIREFHLMKIFTIVVMGISVHSLWYTNAAKATLHGMRDPFDKVQPILEHIYSQVPETPTLMTDEQTGQEHKIDFITIISERISEDELRSIVEFLEYTEHRFIPFFFKYTPFSYSDPELFDEQWQMKTAKSRGLSSLMSILTWLLCVYVKKVCKMKGTPFTEDTILVASASGYQILCMATLFINYGVNQTMMKFFRDLEKEVVNCHHLLMALNKLFDLLYLGTLNQLQTDEELRSLSENPAQKFDRIQQRMIEECTPYESTAGGPPMLQIIAVRGQLRRLTEMYTRHVTAALAAEERRKEEFMQAQKLKKQQRKGMMSMMNMNNEDGSNDLSNSNDVSNEVEFKTQSCLSVGSLLAMPSLIHWYRSSNGYQGWTKNHYATSRMVPDWKSQSKLAQSSFKNPRKLLHCVRKVVFRK